jgi:hypothetical protein
MDNTNEADLAVPWIDRANSGFSIVESGPTCKEWGYNLDSTGLTYLRQTSNSDWNYSVQSNSSSYSCGPERKWRIHGRLRWNASSPFSAAAPLWVTDSVNTWGEISDAPVLVRGILSGPLDLRWDTLARADSSTRSGWSLQPQKLVFLVQQWKSLQSARGRDARVLALDTTSKPIAWRWMDLDTALLHRILVGTIGADRGFGAAEITISAGDSIWLSPSNHLWIQAMVTGTTSNDLYAMVDLTDPYEESITNNYPPDWSSVAAWLSLGTTGFPRSDTADAWFALPNNNRYRSELELAVAGTCPGQRVWLHEGGSNRSQLPHGNVGPLDGFVCEVLTDTMSFPLGQ